MKKELCVDTDCPSKESCGKYKENNQLSEGVDVLYINHHRERDGKPMCNEFQTYESRNRLMFG